MFGLFWPVRDWPVRVSCWDRCCGPPNRQRVAAESQHVLGRLVGVGHPQVARDLDLTQQTALYLQQRIRA